MTNDSISYYYKKKTVVLSAVFIFMPLIVLMMLFIRLSPGFSQGGRSLAALLPLVALMLPLVLLILTLPTLVRDIFNLLTKKPAFKLTPDWLVDNFDRRKYKWTDIESIAHTEKKVKLGTGSTAIVFNNKKKTLTVPDIRIEGDAADFVRDLNSYLKKYGKR